MARSWFTSTSLELFTEHYKQLELLTREQCLRDPKQATNDTQVRQQGPPHSAFEQRDAGREQAALPPSLNLGINSNLYALREQEQQQKEEQVRGPAGKAAARRGLAPAPLLPQRGDNF